MTNNMLYLRVARHKILVVEIYVESNIYEWFSLNIINILSYIILSTDEYRYVIALVFLLSHFYLIILFKNSRNNARGIT
jgi:hypothetical protein